MALEVAIYGKGGIGKSTISSNLSYVLAEKGLKVTQIGCDPKHDSTRALLKGRKLTTVLDMIRTTRVSDRDLGMVMAEGSGGVRCIEAGGPEPGIGCAGKGIISMFQTLSNLGLSELENDVVVYDVLGDVVCGGFAVPMRPDYSDVVFIVSSGEFMSIYAANNIMKGMMNFESEKPRLAGIIFNSRGSAKEAGLIEEFARATGVPIVARIPRSDLFSKAEAGKMTVCEMFPGSPESAVFRNLSEVVSGLNCGKGSLCFPEPLSDDQLDLLVSNGTLSGKGCFRGSKASASDRPRYRKCDVFQPVKRIGMGPIGAAVTAGRIIDVPVVIHGSRSCGYSMLNEIYEDRLVRLERDPQAVTGPGDNILCSCIGATESIFGGSNGLEDLLERLAGRNRFIIVIMTCLTSMIGDDTGSVVQRVTSRHPGVRINIINSNSALEGIDAHMEVIRCLVDMIDVTRNPDGRSVCIVDDNFMAVGKGSDREILGRLMAPFGKEVGPGFISDCTLDDIVSLRRNDLVFLSEDSSDNRELAELLRGKSIRVAMRPLPKGYREGREWVSHLGKMFGNKAAADYLLNMMDFEYRCAVDSARSAVAGRRIAIINDGSELTGWMEEALVDAGAGEVTIYSMGEEAPPQYIGEVRSHPNRSETVSDILADSPDLVIGSRNALRGLGELVCDEFPTTTLAHYASIRFLERVTHLLEAPKTEEWRSWGAS